MKQLTDVDFKKEICACIHPDEFRYLGEKPALIKFYADWCGPCKLLTPTLDALEPEFEEINFFKMDIDTSPDTVGILGVQSIPTIICIPGGDKSPQKITGAIPKEELKKAIKEIYGIETTDVSEF